MFALPVEDGMISSTQRADGVRDKTPLPRRIAVTGSSGYLAHAFGRALTGCGFDGETVGLDIVDGRSWTTDFVQVDLTQRESVGALVECDAIVHLAYVFKPTRHARSESAADLDAYDRVEAALRDPAGPKQAVIASSATVYGAYENNPLPLDETALLRPNEGFTYATCKGEIERRIGELTASDDVSVATLRPAIAFGPNCHNYLAKLFTRPQPFGVRGERPVFQFVHEDDVGRAIVHVLANGLSGAFNIAPDGWMTPSEIDGVVGFGPPRIGLPPDAARRAATRFFDMGITPAPPSEIPYARYPWVVSNAKITNTGFEFEHSNAQALRDTVESQRALGGKHRLERLIFTQRTRA